MSMANIPLIFLESQHQYSYLDFLQAKLQLLKQTPSFPRTIKKKQYNQKQSQSISSSGIKHIFNREKIKNKSQQRQKSVQAEEKNLISKISIKGTSQKKKLQFSSDRILESQYIDKIVNTEKVDKSSIKKLNNKKQMNFQQKKMRKFSMNMLGVIRKQSKMKIAQIKKKKQQASTQNQQNQKLFKFQSSNFNSSQNLKSGSNSFFSRTLRMKCLPFHSNSKLYPQTMHINSRKGMKYTQKRQFRILGARTVNIETKPKQESRIIKNNENNWLQNNFILQPW